MGRKGHATPPRPLRRYSKQTTSISIVLVLWHCIHDGGTYHPPFLDIYLSSVLFLLSIRSTMESALDFFYVEFLFFRLRLLTPWLTSLTGQGLIVGQSEYSGTTSVVAKQENCGHLHVVLSATHAGVITTG